MTVRRQRSTEVTVDPCSACGGSHTFDLTAIVESVDVAGLVAPHSETRTVVLKCPKTGKRISVDVSITLFGPEELVDVR